MRTRFENFQRYSFSTRAFCNETAARNRVHVYEGEGCLANEEKRNLRSPRRQVEVAVVAESRQKLCSQDRVAS